jgi:hypothetical protein
MDDFVQYLDFNFATLCLCCGQKVMDPDKRSGQIHFKGRCPSCGKDSKEEKKISKKKHRKQIREQNLACRGKYIV